MINTKNELIKLFKEIKYAPFPEMKPYVGLADQFSECALEMICDELIARGVIVQTCKPGDKIWVLEREDGEPVDISCVQFLAKSKGCIIATSWINDYDIDETIEYHIDETQNNLDTDLMVYPEEDCFLTIEEAKEKLGECNENGI